MSAWRLHAVFAALLIGTLAAAERARDVLTGPGKVEPVVVRVAEAQGLSYRGLAPSEEEEVRILAFDAPGCADPVLVTLLGVSFEQGPILQLAGLPGGEKRYAYADRVWRTPKRFAIFRVRAKLAILAVIGMTSYVPAAHMLLVEGPAGCRAVDAIDWRMVWDRGYLAGERPPMSGR